MPSSRAISEPGRLPLSNNCTASRLNSGVNCLRVPIGHLLGTCCPRSKVSVKSGPPHPKSFDLTVNLRKPFTAIHYPSITHIHRHGMDKQGERKPAALSAEQDLYGRSFR
jgi:hypothetical protein